MDSIKRKNPFPNGKRKPPPPPKIGERPIHAMTISWDGREDPLLVRAMLDSGCSCPVISASYTDKFAIPYYNRSIPISLGGFDGSVVSDSGDKYTYPLYLHHNSHHVRISLEIAPMDSDCDIMLPFWWTKIHVPSNFFTDDPIEFNSDFCKANCTMENLKEVQISYDESILSEDFPVLCLGYLKINSASQSYIEWSIKANTGTGICSVKPSGAKPDSIDPRLVVPREYHDYIDVFDIKQADKLPVSSSWDHAIDLEPNTQPPWGPIYALSETELKVLKEYLDEMLEAGKIRPSKSPAGAPILFVPKPHGRGLRLCVDYRGINKITIKNRYPLPLMSELKDRVQGAKIFSKIDLKSGFNLIRIKKGDEWKTAFRTRYGHFEYLVMPFGLANAPATFQNMVNDIFRDMTDRGLVAYLDDLFIYSESLEHHRELVKEVLKRMRQNNLVAAIDKCEFHKNKIEFLGHIITAEGVEMSDEKVATIRKWQPPQSLRDVQCFMGFANFYRKFIKDFSRIAKPITDTTKGKGKDWKWTVQCQKAFEELKYKFTSAPILRHFDPELPIVVETDASDFAIGAVLSQVYENRLHPVAYMSRKMDKAELNYEVHDKEMLAIVTCFKDWRRYLEGARYQILVYSDHKNLEYFLTTKVLNRRQARWAQELAGYDFKIVYRPGPKNGKPDALSRRPEFRPCKGGLDDNNADSVPHVLMPIHIEHGPAIISSVRLQQFPVVKFERSFLERIATEGKNDPAWQAESDKASAGDPSKFITLVNGILYYKNRLWIPEDLNLKKEILESEHDSKVAGHMGMDKTQEIIQRNFYWPGMDQEIADYVRSCDTCQRNKAPRHGRYGLLHPLELSYSPWQSISMDFITDLPESNGFTEIWVIIDRYTKMAHFIPLSTGKKKASDLARIFVKGIWRLHGLPVDIVSDQDRRFISDIWQDTCKLLGIRQRMSTAYQPETDGQTERVNSTVEHFLRCFCNYEQNNWDDLLPMAEYAYNNSMTSATGISPFYANYGFHPRTNWPTEEPTRLPASRLYAHWMAGIHELCMKRLEQTHEAMGKYYNRSRLPAPKYKVGDFVMLNGKNLKTRRACRKLDHKLFGPFVIEKIISPMAVRLQLPRTWGIHNVFHVKLLEPYRLSSKRPAPDTDRILDEMEGLTTDIYQVQSIRGSSYNRTRKRVLYLIEWEGFPDRKDWTEEPYENLEISQGVLEELREFHQLNPQFPRDRRVSL